MVDPIPGVSKLNGLCFVFGTDMLSFAFLPWEGSVLNPCTRFFKIADYQTQMSPTLVSFCPFPLSSCFPSVTSLEQQHLLMFFSLSGIHRELKLVEIPLLSSARSRKNQKAFHSSKISYPFHKRVENRCTLLNSDCGLLSDMGNNFIGCHIGYLAAKYLFVLNKQAVAVVKFRAKEA